MNAPQFCPVERPLHRPRNVADAYADLVAGCAQLGQLAAAWSQAEHVAYRDLADVDRVVLGLHNTLIAIRASGSEQ